jgi:hypothetical protein
MLVPFEFKISNIYFIRMTQRISGSVFAPTKFIPSDGAPLKEDLSFRQKVSPTIRGSYKYILDCH